MNDAGFVRRMQMLEETVESLKRLPDRVGALEVRVGSLESQVLQLRTEMRDGFSAIEQRMATKDDLTQFAGKGDLTRFATKDDLERFATKEDLERFATKEDLERFATNDDLERFATKDDLTRFATRVEMYAMKAELQDDIYGVNRDLTGHIVETQRQMRVLYEDLVARITTLGDSRSSGA